MLPFWARRAESSSERAEPTVGSEEEAEGARSKHAHFAFLRGADFFGGALSQREEPQREVLAPPPRHEGHRRHPTADPEAALAILQSSLVDLVIIEPAT